MWREAFPFFQPFRSGDIPLKQFGAAQQIASVAPVLRNDSFLCKEERWR
jgi:hypothetical protein